MALNNPDILYPLLDDMSEKIRFLNHRISYAIDDAKHVVDVSSDQTSQATFDSNHTANTVEEDRRVILYWDNETASMLGKTRQLLQAVAAVHTRLTSIQGACDQSKRYWQGEHTKAVAWLQRAKQRLATAIHNLNIAINDLNIARNNLSRAESALSSCQSSYRTDSNGRRIYNDCSSYQSAVSRARNDVVRAQNECQRWEVEKRDAEAEVARAEARVKCCEQALSVLQQAIDMNTISMGIIQEADSFCRRSMEEIRAAGETIARSKEKNIQQDTCVMENKTHVSIAQNHSNDALTNFIGASKLSNDVQVYGNLATEEISRKVDLLKEFSVSPNNL